MAAAGCRKISPAAFGDPFLLPPPNTAIAPMIRATTTAPAIRALRRPGDPPDGPAATSGGAGGTGGGRAGSPGGAAHVSSPLPAPASGTAAASTRPGATPPRPPSRGRVSPRAVAQALTPQRA